MDQILIEGLAVETCIGVHDWEREIQQRLIFDLVLGVAIEKAAGSDLLVDTIDYEALSNGLCEYVESTRFELLEALAESVVVLLETEFGVVDLKMKISKPGAVPKAKNVAVFLQRGRFQDD